VKKKVYIETTVVSYLTARPSADPVIVGHQEATREFWSRRNEFGLFISDLVLQEAGRGDPGVAKTRLDVLVSLPMLDINDEVKVLAKSLIKAKAVPSESQEDALHIAVATINGLDCIVTWNFAHINNPFTRMRIRHALEAAGHVAPEICSPDELLGGQS